MKQILRTLSLITPLLFTLASAPDALAYYDPGVQRWINRDPLGEQGFETTRSLASDGTLAAFLGSKAGFNSYQFVRNKVTDRVDPFGLLPERIIYPDDPNPFGHWKKPHPFDPACPDDRADLMDCFKQAQAFDNKVFERTGENLSSTEYMEVVEKCMKDKGHLYPPPSP